MKIRGQRNQLGGYWEYFKIRFCCGSVRVRVDLNKLEERINRIVFIFDWT